MNQPDKTSPIAVHCTIDRACLIEKGDELFCTKCQKSLLNMNRPQANEKLTEGRCGFYRALGVTTLASTMALAACKEKKYEGIAVGSVQLPAENRDIVVGRVRMPENEYPVAKQAPGKEGIVISPYSGKEVDVRDIPPGTLVMDPSFPPNEKKFFRVPEMTKEDGAEKKD